MGARNKKLENRYRFQTFSERIAAISADVAHDVSVARNETPEDADTFFFEELQKWCDLNLTQHYAEFQAELGEDVQSFAQLLHRKDEIIGLLQRHLAVPESLALQPLLALLAALARDLRAEMGPAFPSLFGLLCGLLDTHEPERLQWVFTCLAHLYKLLWRHLVAHLEDTYRMYRQLIAGGQPGHVVQFAAESFAFVCRKVKDKTKFFKFIYGKLRGGEWETDGVGRLIFETVRGVRGQLHVDAAGVLHVQLQLLADSQLPTELVQRALSVALQAAARHVNREHAAPIWTELWAAVERCPAEQPELLLRLLQLLLQLVTLQQGALLLDPAEAARCCGQLLSARQLPGPAGHTAAQLAAQLLSCRHARLETTDAARLITQVLRSPQSPAVVLRLPLQLLDEPLMESHALADLVAYLHTLPAGQAPAALGLLSRLVLYKRPPPLHGADWAGWRAYPLDFNFVLHKQCVL